jgi:tripartite-type tricarboxylate transporter receptor subunit TctC
VVENKGGAGGSIGAGYVAKASPDGATLLIGTASTNAINAFLYTHLNFDVARDFQAVTLLVRFPNLLFVNPRIPAKTVPELIAWLKANPGKVNYGSSGIGSIHHLATEALIAALKLNMTHVPYKGMGQAVPALVAGEVTMLYSALPAIEGYIRGGKLKMVAVSTLQRSAEAPDVPTVAELGVPGYHFTPEIGVLAPAGTPPAVVQKLATELGRAARHPDTVARFKQLGIDAVGSSPQEYAKAIDASIRRYTEVVKASGVKAD